VKQCISLSGIKTIFIGIMLSCVVFSFSASSRVWEPTTTRIVSDYASINHNRGSGDFVTIRWLSSPTTAASQQQLIAIFEKYVLIAVVHSRTNFSQPASGTAFDDIKTLEVRDERAMLTLCQRANCRPRAPGFLINTKRDIVADLDHEAAA
jgi:hypothetical protein